MEVDTNEDIDFLNTKRLSFKWFLADNVYMFLGQINLMPSTKQE